ncbi:MAG: SRPBCC domain-containing protein [Acidimicrobiales bacterium]|jgi:carbon monoxide dehydrogenase subunit G
MKLHEEFVVPHGVEDVWRFFEQPEAVAACMPGVESVSVLDDDNVHVCATQSIGPMSATFEAKVAVLERVPLELIRFRVTGRSVRGAIGNLRTENTLALTASDGGTRIVLDGEMALAGALGSVGQKVVAKQAAKATAEFATNLGRALNGESPALPGARGSAATARPEASDGEGVRTFGAVRVPSSGDLGSDRWSKVAAALSAVSVLLSLAALLRYRRLPRQPRAEGR